MRRRDRSPRPLLDLIDDRAPIRPPVAHPAAAAARAAAARRRKTPGKPSSVPVDASATGRSISSSPDPPATRTTSNGTIDPATWSPAMDHAFRATNARLAELAEDQDRSKPIFRDDGLVELPDGFFSAEARNSPERLAAVERRKQTHPHEWSPAELAAELADALATPPSRRAPKGESP